MQQSRDAGDHTVESTADAGVGDAGADPADSFVPSVQAVPLAPFGESEFGQFDPDEIYLSFIAHSTSAAGRQVISHWSQPTVAVGFLPSSAWQPAAGFIRRTDGRFLYLPSDGSFDKSYFFTADATVTAPFTFDAKLADPAANDVAPEPRSCVDAGRYFMSYDGRIISLCGCPGASCHLEDNAGTVIAQLGDTSPPAIFFMDGQGTLIGMNADGSACHVISYAPGSSSAPVTLLESSTPRFFRPVASGFIYGVGADGQMTLKHWRPPTKAGKSLGVYPAPTGTSSTIFPHVDGYGNVYFVVRFDSKPTINVLLRASPGADAPETLFESEASIDIAIFM